MKGPGTVLERLDGVVTLHLPPGITLTFWALSRGWYGIRGEGGGYPHTYINKEAVAYSCFACRGQTLGRED